MSFDLWTTVAHAVNDLVQQKQTQNFGRVIMLGAELENVHAVLRHSVSAANQERISVHVLRMMKRGHDIVTHPTATHADHHVAFFAGFILQPSLEYELLPVVIRERCQHTRRI